MKKFLKQLRSILSGNFLTSPRVRRYYSFLLFVAVIALFYIANTYIAMGRLRHIEETKKTLKTERIILKQTEANYTNSIKQSNLTKSLATTGIQEAHNSVKKIIVDQEEASHE